MELILLLVVFVLGFVTMFIGAISGGVGLITRPVLVFLGIPAPLIIGSSRVAGVFGEIPGLVLLQKHGKIDWKLAPFLIIPNVLGSVIAAVIVVNLSIRSIEFFLGILLLIAGIVFVFNKKIGLEEYEPTIPSKFRNVLAATGTVVVSFMNTITGGLGPLYATLYIWVYGKSYINASALWRVSSYIGALGGAAILIVGGVVDWPLCIALGAGFMIGSYFGTVFGLKKGEGWIRFIVIALAFGAAIKLIAF